ncbi:uncharacterized protein METZ01_LOCUS472868, partial [marine metagenome]
PDPAPLRDLRAPRWGTSPRSQGSPGARIVSFRGRL